MNYIEAVAKVKAIIERKGLTKNQAAAEMGVSRMQLHRVLDGDSGDIPEWMSHFIASNVTSHERIYGAAWEKQLQEWEAEGYKRWISPDQHDNIDTLPQMAEALRYRRWKAGISVDSM